VSQEADPEFPKAESYMPRCLLLLAEGHDHPIPDDELLVRPLYGRGWEVECASWRTPVRWDEYAVVLIRSTWDYHQYPDDFLDVMRVIDASEACLLNDLVLLEWNLQKRYLRDLSERGVSIVPTIWKDELQPGDLKPLFDELGGDGMVVKPVVSASALDTYRVTAATVAPLANHLETLYAGRALMAQPFAQQVLEHGEYSLFYFDGVYSHAAIKRARPGDFRVQTDFGGTVEPMDATVELLAFGEHVMSVLDHDPLYARIDVVRANDGEGLWLMELELIEPELFLRAHPEAPDRFAEAIVQRVAPDVASS